MNLSGKENSMPSFVSSLLGQRAETVSDLHDIVPNLDDDYMSMMGLDDNSQLLSPDDCRFAKASATHAIKWSGY